jgi:MFS family permease
MTETPRHDPYAALRYPEFRALIFGSFLNTCGLLIQEVVLAYEMYRLTHDPLSLGLIGLAEAVPFISLALFGGHLADRRDKRGIMRGSLATVLAGAAVLIAITLPSTQARLPQGAMLLVIYSMFMLVGFARGFYAPAASSLKAFLVPRTLYGNSSTWSSTFWQAGAIVGPGIAGFLYATVGLTGSLAIAFTLFALNLLLVSMIAPRPAVPPPAEALDLWASLAEGVAYVRKSRIILYAISLDMFSVLFGGVVAILPVFAQDILHVGAEGFGLMRAAPAVGALLTISACVFFPPLAAPWRNLLLAVTGFGAATLVFGVSTSYVLSVVALFLTGAFDSVSVLVRQTILQAIPPDHLRGRVQAVNSIFVSSSNELGAFESGLAARLLGAVPSVLLGGVVTLGIVSYVWRRSAELLKVRLD